MRQPVLAPKHLTADNIGWRAKNTPCNGFLGVGPVFRKRRSAAVFAEVWRETGLNETIPYNFRVCDIQLVSPAGPQQTANQLCQISFPAARGIDDGAGSWLRVGRPVSRSEINGHTVEPGRARQVLQPVSLPGGVPVFRGGTPPVLPNTSMMSNGL